MIATVGRWAMNKYSTDFPKLGKVATIQPMNFGYDPSSVEPKWQKAWADAKVYEVDLQNAKKPYFTHVMFPYPSGDKLHIGHWFNYSPADTFARFKRMQGYDVFSPIGFDAFGLPAENYAIKTGVPPQQSIPENVKTMITQLKRIGCMYDWNRMVNTSHPAYYQWTQWLFIQMFKHGLAYKKKASVNFCPNCQTVLANEQVKEGLCERCGTPVIQKMMEQWFWKITNYADRLLAGLDTLDWPEKTKTMQRNWIGRKEGIDITYAIEGSKESVTCFTTRPNTNFGVTFIVLAPEHPFVKKILSGALKSDNKKEIAEYVSASLKKTELERQEEGMTKTGESTGFYAVNNLNNAKIPVWVSDYVLAGFGTGAVVGVPGHDLRDFQFAQKFKLPVVRVVVASDGDTSAIEREEQVQEESGTMINSEFLDGQDIHVATQRIMDHLEEKGWGKRIVTYRLRDWSIGRQRYWGAPIPIVYDPEGTPHAIPEKNLPWLLPQDVEFKPKGTAPLAQSKELFARTEKIFGKGWTPEVDTMDTFVCSSFYYLRYLQVPSPSMGEGRGEGEKIIDPSIERKWMPVSMYIGGAEHACMHLIYARFVMMALKDFGFVSHDEPFKKLVHQGVITNKGAKMSKSKGNVVSPDSFIERHGSDVFRMYLMFMGPFTDGGDWSDTGIRGISRFVQRVYKLIQPLGESDKMNKKSVQDDASVKRALHKTIKQTTESLETLHFNTGISGLMELLNALEKAEHVSTETARTFTKLLAPFAPHLAEELWFALRDNSDCVMVRDFASAKSSRTTAVGIPQGDTIHDFIINQPWPAFDPSLLTSDTMTIVVQVNGKVRGDIQVASNASKEEVIAAAKQNENVMKYIGSGIKKEIYVPGKLVSFCRLIPRRKSGH